MEELNNLLKAIEEFSNTALKAFDDIKKISYKQGYREGYNAKAKEVEEKLDEELRLMEQEHKSEEVCLQN